VGAERAARLRSLGEALDQLASPYAVEEHATLGGGGVFFVDLGSGAGAAGPPERAAAAASLARLACPTVALAPPDADPARSSLRDRFDVVVGSEAEAAPILDAIARAPIAATTLVQLLRLGAALGVDDALVAESLAYSVLQAGPEFAAWRRAHPARARPAPELGPAVAVQRDGDRLELVLNRPARRNAFSVTMRDALAEALQLAVSDASVSEIVLSGAGPSFSSGGDLDEFGSLPDPATAHLVRTTRNVARLLAACTGRTRAVVHGACVGAGVELPAFAQHVEAKPDATFRLPELSLGLVPGAGGTVSLPRRIGRQRTAWLALSGVRIDAATALRWGLVDAVLG
jgi:hypothetical protein